MNDGLCQTVIHYAPIIISVTEKDLCLFKSTSYCKMKMHPEIQHENKKA
jgi:hypothetical protein